MMLHTFKDYGTHHKLVNLKMYYDKLGVDKGSRSIVMPSCMFDDQAVTQGDRYTNGGWYLGTLYGVNVYSDKKLPVKLTVEERLSRLEKEVLC